MRRGRSLLNLRQLIVVFVVAALMAACDDGVGLGAGPTKVTAPRGRIVSFTVTSSALRRNVPVTVYLPPGYPRSSAAYPVLYLLHGLPGSGPEILRDLDFASTANELIDSHRIQPLIVVAPSDGPTATTDTEWINSRVIASWRWGSFVDRDLVAWADAHLDICATRTGRALGGISMGGFGAMNDALRALRVFGAVTLWSPYFISNTPLVDGPAGSAGWLADSPLYDLSKVTSRLARYPLRISFYVGDSDEFASQDIQFAKLLSDDHIAHSFMLEKGGHDYGLWQANLVSQLRWLSAAESC